MLAILLGCDTTPDAEAIDLVWFTERVDCAADRPLWSAPYEEVLVLSAVASTAHLDGSYRRPVTLNWIPGEEQSVGCTTTDDWYVDITWAVQPE